MKEEEAALKARRQRRGGGRKEEGGDGGGGGAGRMKRSRKRTQTRPPYRDAIAAAAASSACIHVVVEVWFAFCEESGLPLDAWRAHDASRTQPTHALHSPQATPVRTSTPLSYSFYIF